MAMHCAVIMITWGDTRAIYRYTKTRYDREAHKKESPHGYRITPALPLLQVCNGSAASTTRQCLEGGERE
jgi:hypothetical protein